MGLPLALAFAEELPTTGLDIAGSRVEELLRGFDRNREVPEDIITSSSVSLTADDSCVTDSDFIVVTVPTPVTADHKPDLSLLESASAMIGIRLRSRSSELPTPIIVFESTTYPGCTEDFCGPIIERNSGLKSGEGFFLGYSPERTNFGDQAHTLETVIKVISGQTPEVAQVVGDIYGLIAKAGTHLAADIRTAEASKVIENIQRDLNIALFNELAIIFDRMNINSSDVFDAAATKWNFHRYLPGLVGGHCIPVDPYYLTHAASETGFEANVVLAGRAVNESMAEYVASKATALLQERGIDPASGSVLVLGATFKNDVVDIRNSKAITLAEHLSKRFGQVDVYDPNVQELNGSGFDQVGDPASARATYTVVVLAVAHSQFDLLVSRLDDFVSPGGLVLDVAGMLDQETVSAMRTPVWSL